MQIADSSFPHIFAMLPGKVNVAAQTGSEIYHTVPSVSDVKA